MMSFNSNLPGTANELHGILFKADSNKALVCILYEVQYDER